MPERLSSVTATWPEVIDAINDLRSDSRYLLDIHRSFPESTHSERAPLDPRKKSPETPGLDPTPITLSDKDVVAISEALVTLQQVANRIRSLKEAVDALDRMLSWLADTDTTDDTKART